MSTTEKDIDRERLEQTAEAERNRLAQTLAALDMRRHHIQEEINPRFQIRQQLPRLIAAGAGLLLAAVAGGVVSYFRARSRRQRMYRERWYGLQRWWNHPEHWARDKRPSAIVEFGRRLIAGVLPAVIAEVAKRQVKHTALLEPHTGPTPQGV